MNIRYGWLMVATGALMGCVAVGALMSLAVFLGWLKDRFGLSWQVVPAKLPELMRDPAKANRVMAEIFRMKKLDLATLEEAAA